MVARPTSVSHLLRHHAVEGLAVGAVMVSPRSAVALRARSHTSMRKMSRASPSWITRQQLRVGVVPWLAEGPLVVVEEVMDEAETRKGKAAEATPVGVAEVSAVEGEAGGTGKR